MEKRSPEHKLEYIICHCINASTMEEVYTILEKEGVSAHFAITPEGEIVEITNPDNIAYHTGASSFHHLNHPISPFTGKQTLNYTSLGIEFLSPGYAKNGNLYHFEPFTHSQKEAAVRLILDLMQKFQISRYNVLGHSDIAPLRKTDPGATFFWDYLDKHEIGIPLPPKGHIGEPHDILWVQESLKNIGYITTPQTGILDEDTKQIIRAFQLHFGGDFLDSCTYGALEFLQKVVEPKK